MAEGVEHIGKKDIIWSYISTFFTVGAGLILLPFILSRMSADTVGIWNIFQVVTMLVTMLDFGFRPSFARNLSYIFSGVKTLQKEGVSAVPINDGSNPVDYSLLKGTLTAMKRFYRWISLGVLVVLATIGSLYLYYILGKYTGDKNDAIAAWILLIFINCYNLYTFYYDALLTGKGYIKRSQQITIIGQAIYLVIAIGLIYSGLGLSAIVAAQLVSIVVRRFLAYRVFYTKQLIEALENATEQNPKQIMNAIYPNAVKVGLTQLGGFAVNKSAVLMGSAFLSLEQVACYGITLQVMEILCRCSQVPYQSFMPKLAQCRAESDWKGLKRYYIFNVISLLSIFSLGGLLWVFLGDWALQLIDSDTLFVPTGMLVAMIAIHFLEDNHATASGFIMADNKIPFFIPSLLSGAATVLLLWIFLGPLHWGLWGMILAPGIAQLAYQNWKWPSMLIREIHTHLKDEHHV